MRRWLLVSTLAAGCAKAPAVAGPADLSTLHMVELVDTADAARLAVIAGHVPTARHHLGQLAEHGIDPRRVDERLRPWATALVEHARAGSQAVQLPELARATAEVGRACGECHVAAGVAPRFAEAGVASGSDIVAHMARHQWGVDSLWEGLVGPHEDLWQAGGATFLEIPVDPAEEPVVPAQFLPLADRVHDVGSETLGLRDPEARAEQYAQLLAACGGCHQAIGGPPVTPVSPVSE